jgi:hypothetical protein
MKRNWKKTKKTEQHMTTMMHHLFSVHIVTVLLLAKPHEFQSCKLLDLNMFSLTMLNSSRWCPLLCRKTEEPLLDSIK